MTFAVSDRPMVVAFHPENVLRLSRGSFSGENKQDRGAVFAGEVGLKMLKHADIPPQALGGYKAGDVRQEIIGRVAEKGFAIAFEFVAGALLFVKSERACRNAVVGEIDGTVGKFLA